MFSKKKKTEITDLQLDSIAVVVDNFRPVNGKTAIIKGQDKKQIIFKAQKVLEGKAYGTMMIANEVDEQGDFYSLETVRKTAKYVDDVIKKGGEIPFNLNHDGEYLGGIKIIESIFDPIKKAWECWIDFSQNNFLVQKAIDGNFHGFSIEGMGVRIEKAQNLKETVKEKEKNSALKMLTESLERTIEETLYDYTLTDIDKKGNLELALSDYFELANKEIDSIFNNNIILKAGAKKMDENAIKTLVINTLKEHSELESVQKAKEQEESKQETRLVEIEKGLEEIKKALASSESGKDEGAKIKKAEEEEVSPFSVAFKKTEGK